MRTRVEVVRSSFEDDSYRGPVGHLYVTAGWPTSDRSKFEGKPHKPGEWASLDIARFRFFEKTVEVELHMRSRQPWWAVTATWHPHRHTDGGRLALTACQTKEFRPFLDWLAEYEEATRGPGRDLIARVVALIAGAT